MTRTRRGRNSWRESLVLWGAAAGALWLAWQLFQFTTPTTAGSVRPPPVSSAPVSSPPASPRVIDSHIAELRLRHLQIPVAGVPASSLVSTFHQQRGAGDREHEALDIMAARGTPVVAVEDGRIAKLFTSERGGLTIYQFDPGETYCYYYAHLDHYAAGVRDGAWLERGQTIGFVGSTGNAAENAPHLHFAVFQLGPEKRWWEGAALDPFLIWREPHLRLLPPPSEPRQSPPARQ